MMCIYRLSRRFGSVEPAKKINLIKTCFIYFVCFIYLAVAGFKGQCKCANIANKSFFIVNSDLSKQKNLKSNVTL